MQTAEYRSVLMGKKTPELVDIHNSIQGAKQVGPKTFNTKAKLVQAIAQATFNLTQGDTPKKVETKAPTKKTGGTIQALAQSLLVTTAPYVDILGQIKQQHPDARTSLGCLRWYAARMRETGVEVPDRRGAKPQ